MPLRFEKSLIANLGAFSYPLQSAGSIGAMNRACGSCHLQLSARPTTPEGVRSFALMREAFFEAWLLRVPQQCLCVKKQAELQESATESLDFA